MPARPIELNGNNVGVALRASGAGSSGTIRGFIIQSLHRQRHWEISGSNNNLIG